MISYIKGPLTAIEEDVIVVEAGGVGMGIHVPLSVLDRLPGIGREVTVYTYFQVREDAMSLYGFLNRQDRDMFRQLIGVNGVGPKAALGILSTMTPDDLRMAIVTGDAKAISRAPGIGPKTAQRLILDLKDKISMEEVLGLSLIHILPGAADQVKAGGVPGKSGGLNIKKEQFVQTADPRQIICILKFDGVFNSYHIR